MYKQNSKLSYLLLQGGYVVRHRYAAGILQALRKLWYKSLGLQVGHRTSIPKIYITWPHQVKIGTKCVLEENIVFKYDGTLSVGPSIRIGDDVFIGNSCEFNIRNGITIGGNSLIASGCKFIDHDHGMKLGQLIKKQHGQEKEIIIGEDVWLGVNVVVLKGVTIADGSVVAAGSVVTKSIPKGEIWAGIPAKKLADRG
jgi:acetyltransferase-like isoleucine patch superfamily enzyme